MTTTDTPFATAARERVFIQEVGLRDGLQMVQRVMPTADKKRWIDAAHAAGVRQIEVTSFVPPRLLPQLADAEEIVAHSLGLEGLLVTALVPNVRGAERALAAGAQRVSVPLSVSPAHSLANVRRTPAAMLDEIAAIGGLCRAAGAQFDVGLSTAFGCTLQGPVPIAAVVKCVQRIVDIGCDAITVCDTTGHATPGHVQELLDAVVPAAQGCTLIGHFHDTRGMALANTLVALQHGLRHFDASLAGLGGCPHAPRATGNVATEDLVFMLESLGYATGIDVTALLACRRVLEEALPGEELHGALARAGLPAELARSHAAWRGAALPA